MPIHKRISGALLLFLILAVSFQSRVGAQLVITEPAMSYGFGTLNDMAYSPQGNLIATAGGGGIVLWDAETIEQVRHIRQSGLNVSSIDFSPDGTQVLSGSGMVAQLWDAATGEEIRRFEGHTQGVTSVTFSPDGTRILTGSWDRTARLWNATTGEETRRLEGHDTSVESVAFSPDGTQILVGSWGTAFLWDATTGEELRRFIVGDQPIDSVAFSPGGSQVLMTYNPGARLFNASSGEEIHSFARGSTISSVAFSPDGTQIMTGDIGGIARLWDVASGSELEDFTGHVEEIYSIAFFPSGWSILTGSEDGTVRLWEKETGEELRRFEGHTAKPQAVTFSPDGAQIMTGGDRSSFGRAAIWDTTNGERMRGLVEHEGGGWANTVGFSPDGLRVLTGESFGGARLWDLSTGEELRRFDIDNGLYNTRAAISPDGSHVLTGSDNGSFPTEIIVILWETETGEELRRFEGHTNDVTSVAFSSDGEQILTGSFDDTARLWDATNGEEIRRLEGHANGLTSVAFSPDGMHILTGSWDNTARLWDAETGEEIRRFEGDTYDVTSVAFSPDGTQALTGGWDRTVRLWDVSTGNELRRFQGHTSAVTSVAFSPDGRQIVSAGQDGQTLLWENVPREKDKLLLVAGGGDYIGNPIRTQTQALADRFHLVAQIRNVEAENILYLSAFETPEENPLVDGAATQIAIEEAILEWSIDARRLTIVLIDHGSWNDQGTPSPDDDEWFFYIDETQSPPDRLSTAELKSMLDEAQSGADPLPKVVLISEMCFSGGLVQRLAGAPEGTTRIIISSTAPDQDANIGTSSGDLSFLSSFMSSAKRGKNLYDCFFAGRELVGFLRGNNGAPQSPWLDDDGDGVFTGFDGDEARGTVLGNSPLFSIASTSQPTLDFVAPDIFLEEPADTTLWCEIFFSIPDRVVAYVSYASDIYEEGEPITDHTVVELTREDTTSRWSGTLSAANISRTGEYSIIYLAANSDSLSNELETYSTPINRTLTVGSAPVLLGDANRDGILSPGDAQLVFECYLDQVCADPIPSAGDLCEPLDVITPSDAQEVFQRALGFPEECE